MLNIKNTVLYLLGASIALFSNACFAGRYDTGHGSLGWIVWGNVFTLGVVWYLAYGRIKEAIENEESLLKLYHGWLTSSLFLVVITVVLAWIDLGSEYYIYILRPILFVSAVLAIFTILSSGNISKGLLFMMGFFAFIHNPIRYCQLNLNCSNFLENSGSTQPRINTLWVYF